MPDPINSSSSNANQSYYDPNECDPTRTSCAPPPEPKVVTLDPVLIEGSVPHKAPSCSRELKIAAATCSLAVAGVAAGAVAGRVSAAQIVGVAKEAMGCVKLITDYDNCKEDGAMRAAAANRCEADGGVAVGGVEKNEVVCLKGAVSR